MKMASLLDIPNLRKSGNGGRTMASNLRNNSNNMGTIMIDYSKLEAMILAYPNDQALGAFVRSLYHSEQRRKELIKKQTDPRHNQW